MSVIASTYWVRGDPMKDRELFWREKDIPSRFRVASPLNSRQYLSHGEILSWKGKVAPVLSPIYIKESRRFVRKKLGGYPLLGRAESLDALKSAKKAFDGGNGEWPSLSLGQRVECVNDFMSRLLKRKKEITTLMMWEIAKPYKELEDEFERTVDYIAQVTRLALEKENGYSAIARDKGILGIIRDEPLGVALCLGPYNYPLFETLGLIFPALLMGNTVLLKPPRLGVLFFNYLLESFAECFPPGAINCLFGEGPALIEPLMRSGEIDIFAFIGSARTANHLINLHPRKNRLKSLLGLGAKNVAVILPDSELDTTVKESILGALAFNGQRCAALKMFFVHDDIIEDFLRALTAGVEEIKIGMPWEWGVRITPLADTGRIPYLLDMVGDAVRHGARVVNILGGRLAKSIFCPTILHPVKSRMKIYHEEQFAPIIPIAAFQNIETPSEYIASSSFGQQASIFGKDAWMIRTFVNLVKNQVSRVNINAKCQRGPDLFPFAGRKDSAKGDFAATGILDAFAAKSVLAARENPWSQKLFRKFIE